MAGLDLFERLTEEMPELSASVGGVALMALATGLSRRLDAAWAATVALLAATAAYAFFRHEHILGASAAALIALTLGLARPAFYRHSRLTELLPERGLAIAISAALGVGIVAGLLWAGGRPGFAAAPWWALLTDPHLGRPGPQCRGGDRGARRAARMALSAEPPRPRTGARDRHRSRARRSAVAERRRGAARRRTRFHR
ncbi:MAG: hypothetical protein WDM79_12335 [Terricaulis sp.]